MLLTRTTRSVSVTDTGRRLMESAGPAFGQVIAALGEVSAKPGEVVGRVRLSVPRLAVPFVIDPVLPTFRARHPRIEVEVAVSDRLVDIVAEGFDAGVRSSDVIERDMVQVRLTDSFRFVVVGTPDYLARHGTPQRPEDLLRHRVDRSAPDRCASSSRRRRSSHSGRSEAPTTFAYPRGP